MHKFSDFADEKALDGNKLFINNVVNKEIEILNFRISKSKQKAGTNCLTLQFKLDGIVYVLFGKQAQTFKYYINSKMNNIIEVNHPAYYARTETKMPHEIFKEIDNLMLKKYNKKITWFNEPINN